MSEILAFDCYSSIRGGANEISRYDSDSTLNKHF